MKLFKSLKNIINPGSIKFINDWLSNTKKRL